jgi:general secretion pathway protein A
VYDQIFGLSKKPFNLTPDPAFLFLTSQHREALVGLTYAILQRKGFVVLTGEVGVGKTTLLARVLHFLPANRLQFAVILNPTLTAAEFLELALLDFGITDIPASKAQRLWKLQNLIFEGRRQGKVTALIVDEAHKLSADVLEEIRLLGNFEQTDEKLLQILLVGQNELEENLNREDLRQLKQRIALWLRIGPLDPAEVGQYIRYRWLTAGGTQPPFSSEAIDMIVFASRGVPRLINSLCDNALTLVLAEGNTEVEGRHVLMAAADLNISDGRRPIIMAEEVSEPGQPIELPILDRHRDTSQRSLWTKWAGKFGVAARHDAS